MLKAAPVSASWPCPDGGRLEEVSTEGGVSVFWFDNRVAAEDCSDGSEFWEEWLTRSLELSEDCASEEGDMEVVDNS